MVGLCRVRAVSDCRPSLDVLLLFHLAPDAGHGGELEVGPAAAEAETEAAVAIEAAGRGRRRRGSLEPDAPLPALLLRFLVVVFVVVVVDRPLRFRRGIRRRAPESVPVSRIGGGCFVYRFHNAVDLS